MTCNYTRTAPSLKKTKIPSMRNSMERWLPSPTPLKTRSRVLDCLQGRPNCQKLRKDSIWGIEFFDPIFAFPEDPISFYLDADILFLRPFSGLFDREQVKNGAVFLKDTQWDAYSFRPWQMITGKSKPQAVKGSPQDWCFGINQQSTGITSSGFWESIDFTKFLNGSCPPPRQVWPIDVRRKRFPQDTFQTFIQTPKFMKIPLAYTC